MRITQDGIQSALNPAGRDAESIAQLFGWVSFAFIAIWLAVLALAVYAPRAQPSKQASYYLILGGGVALPVIVLTTLLFFSLAGIKSVTTPAADTRTTIEVVGHQWWWRVRYVEGTNAPIELANEVHLPLGRRINTRLMSADVVHSFWIPPLAGKMDMIPGRINRLALEPTRLGTFRGACAEYCGTAHARMNLLAVIVEEREFEAWLSHQSQPATPPADPIAARGAQAFFERGCNTCHTVRGTDAVGMAGPDLTHVGSRRTLAAATLPANDEQLRRWISSTELLKPGVHMPAFAHVPAGDLAALSAFLVHLK